MTDALAPGARVRLGGVVAFATPDRRVGSTWDGVTYRVRAPGGDTVQCVPREALTPEPLTVENLDASEIEALQRETEAHAYPGADPKWRDMWNACSNVIECSTNECPECQTDRALIVAHLTQPAAKP